MKALDDSKLRRRYRNAYIALYVIGGLTMLLGLAAALGRVEVLPEVFAVEGASGGGFPLHHLCDDSAAYDDRRGIVS